MNEKESREFLQGKMSFSPQRMMRYIRSRARTSSDEDIEDILQNALILVTQHFDPGHQEANLSLYCLGACNKAIAQNLERYHKIVLKKREQTKSERGKPEPTLSVGKTVVEGQVMTVKALSPGKAFNEEPTVSQRRTTSLDSMFDEDDGRSPEDVVGFNFSVTSSNSLGQDPAAGTLLKDLIDQILQELPTPMHRTCFLLKYVEGYKREDLIACLKMDAKSIDTVDKKIVRTLKAFREKLENDESHI